MRASPVFGRWLPYAVLLVLGAGALIVVVFAIQVRARLPELEAWHRVQLEEEFRAGRASSLAEYLKLEERLFAELRQRIYADAVAASPHAISRYRPGSVPAVLAAQCCWYTGLPTRPIACAPWQSSSSSAATMCSRRCRRSRCSSR